MKVLLHGKNSQKITPLVKKLGIGIVNTNPDVIISFGGDGTLLVSEKLYPGIPKLPIRDSAICKKCPKHKEETLLKQLLDNSLELKEYKKLTTTIFYKDFYALNDFVIRNLTPIHTIRFKVIPGNKLFIGDGVVVSTPFGSTGYFKSITGKSFQEDFGVAFNNTTEKNSPALFDR